MAAGSDTLHVARQGSARASEDACSFRHQLTFYDAGANGFIGHTLPLVRRALAAAEPVLALVPMRRAESLMEALGSDAERILFLDVQQIGRNPARLIPALRSFVQGNRTDAAGLGLCEPAWPGRSGAEFAECERHEALLNCVFADGPSWQLVCPYDLDALDDDVLESAQRTHPFHSHAGALHANGRCRRITPNVLAGSLPPPAIPFVELDFGIGELSKARQMTVAWATGQQLAPEQIEELVLAVNELAGNSLRHAGGRGRLRMWRDGDTLVCEVFDHGAIRDQLVGRVQPEPFATGGRGMWIVNQLCDLVQIRSSRSGTVVRVHKRRA